MEQKLKAYFEEHKEEIMDDLLRLVKTEASTSDLAELAEVRKVLKEIITARTGAEVTEHEREGGHNPLSFTVGEGEEKVVLVGHYDTVHPIGSLPIYREGSKLHGPGVYDMKSGLVSSIWMAKAYKDLGIDPGKKLVYVFNGDEETGSAESKELIDETAKGSKATLICEPAMANGDLKSGRKGNGFITVTVTGKAAHAGNAHQLGRNAIEEMAHEILFIQSLTDYEKGTTVNVGVCTGGTKSNVVPAEAYYEVDIRILEKEEWIRVRDAIVNFEVKVEGTSRKVDVREGVPPMPENEANQALFALAKKCGEKLGISFEGHVVGGVSDGNHVSDLGIPTLDSMGAVGDGAHAAHEYIDVDQYTERMALLAAVVMHI